MAIGKYGGECVSAHRAFIFDRGGKRRRGVLDDINLVDYTRDRDSMSEGNVTLQGSSCSRQADFLSTIEPRRDELVIFRGDERVWEGPVNRVAWHADKVVIAAHDCFDYILNTPMSQTYSSAYPNVEAVTARIQRILEHEMQVWETLDPPVNLLDHMQIHHFPNEAETTAVTRPFEMTVGEHIQSLARYSGIDFTMVGRSLHVWDVSRSLGRLRTLTEKDFLSEVVITAYGSDLAAAVYVVAQDGRYGSATEASPYYGPWTKILTAYSEEGAEAPTQGELDSQAQRNLNGRLPVPVEVRIPDNSSVRLSETLSINDLIPGVQVPLLATLNARQLSQMQKIDRVRVVENPEKETVSITLTPATKPDSDEEA